MSQGAESDRPRVAIIGGGLAGMAAAAALAPRGCEVHLFESRRKLGGRAGSYVDRTSGESIDHCQHVAMGCCTNYLHFCQSTGIDDCFSRHRTLHFFSPEGRRSDFSPSRWLPAPVHLLGALLSLRFLSWTDKLSIARAMRDLIRAPVADHADGPTVLQWLRAQRQSPAAIERFWNVVLVSALAESLECASLAAARKVFIDGFLANHNASDILIPRVSLDELYDHRVGQWLGERGATLHRQTPIEGITNRNHRIGGVKLSDGSILAFDFVVLAAAWMRVTRLLGPDLVDLVDPQDKVATLASAPISSVHLWFDRPITDLPHAIFIGRLSQWLFARRSGTQAGEYYYQVVISASYDLIGRERSTVVEQVVEDLKLVFPAARSAALLRWQLITEQNAVFSMQPGIDPIRPPQQTPIPNLFLAGDWTRTFWPATMEGAVRSGYLAAEALLMQLGRPERILAPDLPRNWLTSRF